MPINNINNFPVNFDQNMMNFQNDFNLNNEVFQNDINQNMEDLGIYEINNEI